MNASEAGFTKGPWEARGREIFADSGLLATVAFRLDENEQAANVSAITATPGVLAALQEILGVEVTSPEGGHEEVLEIHRIARAALAKLEGK